MLRDYFYSGHEKNKRRRVRKCCATMGSRHHQSLVGFGEIAFTSRHQKCKPQMESDLLGGMTSLNAKNVAKPSQGVRVLLRLAVKQSQFGEFLLFFPPILHLFVVVHVSVN